MILQQLSILHYKNIKETTLRLSPKINCFIGSNGVGKTNLLDAVYYLSFCRSAYTPIDAQVMMHDTDFFVLEGHYQSETGEEEQVYCGMKKGVRKRFKRNGKDYKRLTEHIGLVPLVFVSPADSTVIDGGSEERRRLLDTAIAQYDVAYMDALVRYNKALQQRNVLLKIETEPDAALMDIWEEEMAQSGTIVYEKRARYVEELLPLFQRIYSSIVENKEQVGLSFVSHGSRGDMLSTIRNGRSRDRAVGYSLHGVHRDDLDMTLGGYPVKREGSQGQRKSFVLALKLAQYMLLREQHGTNIPLLLLDDIFDKLDAHRVEQIVQLVAGDAFGQIFITDTNREHLDSILRHGDFDYKLFAVNDGEVNLKGETAHV